MATPPELTETHRGVGAPDPLDERDGGATEGTPGERVAATLRDPGPPMESTTLKNVPAPGRVQVGGRRLPEPVMIVKEHGATLPLGARAELMELPTLVSPPDPLAARQAAHARAHDAARTLLSGLAAPPAARTAAGPPVAAQGWSGRDAISAAPGGTLLSPPLGSPPLGGGGIGGPGPRPSFAAVAPAQRGLEPETAPAAGQRWPTAFLAALGLLGIVLLGAGAFAGTYYGARARVGGAPAPPTPALPTAEPTPAPPSSSAAPDPPPTTITPKPTPTALPMDRPSKAHGGEPPACAAHRAQRAKPNASPATLASLEAACRRQGGTPSPAPSPPIVPF